MTRTKFKALLAASKAKVDAGVLNWGSMITLTREFIKRAEESVRPVPGYANCSNHTDRLADIEFGKQKLLEIRATYA
ncbi:hypothetical protein FIU93_22805 [Labrenzia sp. THAF35]|uniref:hypothetical protein n=1 Tax=Labrenzia sp. THAF35 TaxID=2587854 RepID=UPI00126954F9|nr:hypothetical protein [Labrenzia sp. THAF35]QFT69632.1 hypothetical protein FIU93_22805 [Labrenzia sp. THAF35]